MPGDFSNNSERHGVPSWKQQLDFIFIHNSQELEMQIEVEMQEMERAGLEPCMCGSEADFSSSAHSTNIYSVSFI